MQDPTSIIVNLLTAIDYTGDKQAFAEEFITVIYMRALSDLVKSLAEEQQEKVKQECFAVANDIPKIVEVLKKYFTGDQTDNAIENAGKATLEDWLKEVLPSLQDSQKQNLQSALKALQA